LPKLAVLLLNATDMQLQWVSSITEIDKASWQALFTTSYPFTQYGFLHALEQGGSVDSTALVQQNNTGWQSLHLVISDNGKLVAIMPAYLKMHSYGEYLFDWQFARAYQQQGLEYYPKLITAIPFTPAQGPRIAIAPGCDTDKVMAAVLLAVRELRQKLNLSQFQALYVDTAEQAAWQALGLQQRFDVQFQWHNNNYLQFDDFLAALTSRKSKQIRNERAKVAEQGVNICVLTGNELDDNFWLQFYYFYTATYAKRSGHHGYLTLQTFKLWGSALANPIVVLAAYHAEKMVAASLCFFSNNTLYGRYWGCAAEYDRLHFECCYYQGIDYCIAHQLQYFDAGAQGEHKLQRGFAPVIRSGFYDINATVLSSAITQYCLMEQQQLTQYAEQAKALLPFAAK